jgi:membrane-associated phospholipid phosphatase
MTNANNYANAPTSFQRQGRAALLLILVVTPLALADLASAQSVTAGPAATIAWEQGKTAPAVPATTRRHPGIKTMFKDLVADVSHLPAKENLFWAAVGGGLALAAHPADVDVNRRLVGSTIARRTFRPGRIMGTFATLAGSAATVYGLGRARDQPRLSHLGMDLMQSLLVSEGITQSLKRLTNRERPDGSSRNSFPSGHAADTFAFATALERHFGWKGAAPAFAFASYVAISRLPANRHWLSDAVFGASVGIVAGRTVTRHGKPFPITVGAGPGGFQVGYVRNY